MAPVGNLVADNSLIAFGACLTRRARHACCKFSGSWQYLEYQSQVAPVLLANLESQLAQSRHSSLSSASGTRRTGCADNSLIAFGACRTRRAGSSLRPSRARCTIGASDTL